MKKNTLKSYTQQSICPTLYTCTHSRNKMLSLYALLDSQPNMCFLMIRLIDKLAKCNIAELLYVYASINMHKLFNFSQLMPTSCQFFNIFLFDRKYPISALSLISFIITKIITITFFLSSSFILLTSRNYRNLCFLSSVRVKRTSTTIMMAQALGINQTLTNQKLTNKLISF